MYRTEQRIGSIISAFTALAIFIGCLGLFGLAAFTAEQRTREIGVRRVLGASIPSIIMLLSKQFVRWIVLAAIIAWPISYFSMKQWLQGFAFRTGLSLWIFILASSTILIIALLTVSYQSVRAARANPVDSLKYE